MDLTILPKGDYPFRGEWAQAALLLLYLISKWASAINKCGRVCLFRWMSNVEK